MCLAVPGKIIAIKEKTATVDYGTEQREGTLLESAYNIGDYVIIQGHMVVEKIDEEEAKQALALYQKTISEADAGSKPQ